MGGWLANGFSVLLGVGAAIVTTVVMNSEAGRATNEAPSVASKAGPDVDMARRPVRQQQGPRVEARPIVNDEARDSVGERPLEQVTASTEESAELEEPSREAARARMASKYARYAAVHENDPVDPEWAPDAESHLEHALELWSLKADARVVDAECKTEVCRAKIEWQDYATARTQGAALAEMEIPGLNCSQRIGLQEPEDRKLAYSAYLYLDCSKLRSGMVDAEP